jgi:hypothetical protein
LLAREELPPTTARAAQQDQRKKALIKTVDYACERGAVVKKFFWPPRSACVLFPHNETENCPMRPGFRGIKHFLADFSRKLIRRTHAVS